MRRTAAVLAALVIIGGGTFAGWPFTPHSPCGPRVPGTHQPHHCHRPVF